MNTIIKLRFTSDGYYHCDGLPRPIKIGGGFQGDLGCGACARFVTCTMSHVAVLATTVHDLDAIERLCKVKGWQFKRNQKTHRGYQSTPGQCEHAIGIPGTEWELGLRKVGMVKDPVDGTMVDGGYRLAYDFYGMSGEPLRNAIGQDGGIFLQGYGLELAKMTAENLGYFGMEETTLENGDVQLEVQVAG